MKKEKVSKDGTTEYDWVIFAQSYFYIARLACQELLDEKREKHDKSLSSNIKLPYRTSDLYVAILFNIKHGIEVFIKSFGIFDFEEYEKGHDIYDLFQSFRKKMEVRVDEKDLNRIEELITYFYKPNFLKSKVKEFYEVTDAKNDIFRYPDNNAKIQLQWELIIDLFDRQDIEELKNYLDELLGLLNKTGFKIASQSKQSSQ